MFSLGSEELLKSVQTIKAQGLTLKSRQKAEVLVLRHHGVKVSQVAAVCQMTERCVYQYQKAFLAKGLASLDETPRCSRSALTTHTDLMKAEFEKQPPRTVREAQVRIQEKTGLQRGKTQTRLFLHKLGFKVRRVGGIPSKADPQAQKDFLETEMEPRLEQAQQEKRVVLFLDAAHIIFGGFLGFVWCLRRLFLPTSAGRKRLNILAALNATSKKLTWLVNDTIINGKVFCQFLRKLRVEYGGRALTLILDNARYQKCALVKECAAQLGIELLYLPPYSPNLNLIERYWKQLRSQLLHCRYYENFTLFTQEAIRIMKNSNKTKSKPDMESLLTLQFQTFEKPQLDMWSRPPPI